MDPQDNPATTLDLEGITARLRAVLAALGVDGTVFCERSGIPYSTWRTYMSGKRPPSPEALVAMLRAYGISPGWVLANVGPMGLGARGANLPAASAQEQTSELAVQEPAAAWRLPASTANTDTIRIGGVPRLATGPTAPTGALLPHIGAKAVRPLVLSLPQGDVGGQSIRYQVIPRRVRPAAAGSPAPAADGQDVVDLAGDMAFSFEWLRRNLQHTVGLLTSSKVSGDSMAPTLLDGETIVVDEGVKTVDVDGIYVLDVYGRRLVKRVQHFVDGSLVLISDNPAYRRETIRRDMARDVLVIGRMVWPRLR